MIKDIDYALYIWKLYYERGKALMDYIFDLHKNHIDKGHLDGLFTEISQNRNIDIYLKDRVGCYTDMLCNKLEREYTGKSNLFLFEDDRFSQKVNCGIYIDRLNVFICKGNSSIDSPASYFISPDVEKYIYTAKQYFEIIRNIANTPEV